MLKTFRYGRLLEDFQTGATYAHPWQVTIDQGTIAFFQASFLDASPVYASNTLARAVGFRERPIHPLLLLNLGLSFSVHDVSEQAIAHLAYLDVRFPNPCYAGDTVEASSKVLGVKPSSTGDKGVVHVRTILQNHMGEPVCVFERKALVRAGKLNTRPLESFPPMPQRDPGEVPKLPPNLRGLPRLPNEMKPTLQGLFDDFTPGDVFAHQVGKTIGESEHMQLTYLVRNTHPLHFDEHYCRDEGNSFAKTRVVYGGLVFAWIASLASRDVSGNVFWDVRFDDGAHPNGVVAGDTLYAASQVLDTRALNDNWGEIDFRLVGLKNVRPDTLLAQGADLFAPELSKDKEKKITSKVFEITRTVLVRR